MSIRTNVFNSSAIQHCGVPQVEQRKFVYDCDLMRITDADVLEKLIAPAVYEVLALSELKCNPSGFTAVHQGQPLSVSAVTRFKNAVETVEYTSSNFRIVIRRDGINLLTDVFVTPTGGEPEIRILRSGLRDRKLDASPCAAPLDECPTAHPATNTLPHPEFKAVELAIYCLDPRQMLAPGKTRQFIADVEQYMYEHFEPGEFFNQWSKAFDSGMAPWQVGVPIKGAAAYFVNAVQSLLKALGYNQMDACPSWYNGVRFFHDNLGFSFTFGEHEASYQRLEKALSQTETSIGYKMNIRQRAWLVALQNIPEYYIPEKLRLGCKWINSPGGSDYLCRLHITLNKFEPKAIFQPTLPPVFSR